MKTAFRLATIMVLAAASASGALRLDCAESVPEGEAFLVTVNGEGDGADLAVRWLGREIHPAVETGRGGFTARILLGVGMRERLEADGYTLEVDAGGEVLRRSIRREPKAYPEQHLTVEKKYNELPVATLERDRREKAATREAMDTISPSRLWSLPFSRPVPGGVTSDFGLRRFFNEEPKSPHSGVDLHAAEGDSVLACADGRVLLTGNHYFAGNSIYLDHGEGVVSMYFHLSRILVKEGQRVQRGQPIGLAGATGRVTGPHLHWGLSLLGQLVDPMPLLEGSAP